MKWYSYPMTKRTRTIPAFPIKHELNPNVVCRKSELQNYISFMHERCHKTSSHTSKQEETFQNTLTKIQKKKASSNAFCYKDTRTIISLLLTQPLPSISFTKLENSSMKCTSKTTLTEATALCHFRELAALKPS